MTSTTANIMPTQLAAQLMTDIIQAGSDNRPPMLSRGSYTQWVSRMRRFIEDKPDGDMIWHSIEYGPFKRQEVMIPSTSDPPSAPTIGPQMIQHSQMKIKLT